MNTALAVGGEHNGKLIEVNHEITTHILVGNETYRRCGSFAHNGEAKPLFVCENLTSLDQWELDERISSAISLFADSLKQYPDGTSSLDFSSALRYVKAGKNLQRVGWQGKSKYIFLVPGSTFKVNRPPLLGIYAEGTEIQYHAHVDIHMSDGVVCPYNFPQSDVLATDWQIVEDVLAC